MADFFKPTEQKPLTTDFLNVRLILFYYNWLWHRESSSWKLMWKFPNTIGEGGGGWDGLNVVARVFHKIILLVIIYQNTEKKCLQSDWVQSHKLPHNIVNFPGNSVIFKRLS